MLQEILFIIILVVLITTSYYQIIYLLKLPKNQEDYPLKQLSPKITLHQGIFLLLSQFVLVSEIFMFVSDWNIQCEQKNPVQIGFIAFFYIFSRGCCFSFALLKTARITVAFGKHLLEPQSYKTKYYSSENKLLLTGYLYSFIGFPLLSFLTTYFECDGKISCWLDNYHINKSYIMINSLIEESVCIILMGYIIVYHLEDKLYKLTFNVLGYYMIWFLFASIIVKIWADNKVINFLVSLSFLFRAQLMFYIYIIQPIKQVEMHPTLYLTSNKIDNFQKVSSLKFQGHFQDSIILKQFEEYLKDLDQQDKNKFYQSQAKTNFSQFKQQKLYQIFIKLSKYLNGPAPMNIIEEFLIKEFNNHEILNQFNSPEILEQHLSEYLLTVYENGFKNTNAFHTINNYYRAYETAVKNLETLGMNLVEYDPLKE